MLPGRRFRTALGVLLASAVMTVPAAQGAEGDSGNGSGVYGWGPHIGLGGDPDQLLLGLHFDVGRIAPRVRFQPDVELGIGDNHTIFEITLPAHYLFRTRTEIHPYAGGGVLIGVDERDRPSGDDTETEIGIALTGGLEWRTAHGDRFFLELSLQAGDLHDFQATGGITF